MGGFGCQLWPFGGGGPARDPAHVQGSSEWTARSSPLAVEYLRTLPDQRVGQPLAGIALSDGGRWLEGFVFVGRVEVDHPGLHVVVIASPEGKRRAFFWIDEPGSPLALEICPPVEQGIRARTLTGDIYTWKSLQPGGGIVTTECPPKHWNIDALGGSLQTPPGEHDEEKRQR